MATLYWGPALVGGSSTGNWDGSTTTNWFTDAARTIQASAAPTSADDVIFDNASAAGAFVVTIVAGAVCRDVTISGVPASMTLAGSAAWTVYGSLTFPAINLTRTYSGTITFAATATGKTITTNGVTLTSGSATFDGVGGGWTLGSALTVTTTITLTNGTLDTSASNYAVTTGTFVSNNSNVRSLVLNGSTMTLTTSTTPSFNATTSTNFTLTAGTTSTLTLSAAIGGIAASTTLTFGNISATSLSTSLTLTGNFVCQNFTTSGRGSTGMNSVVLGGNLTVNGTFLANSGGTSTVRTFYQSSVIGTQRTLSIATLSASATDLDFRDIAVTGAAAPINDASRSRRLSDCNNNSGITFSAGVAKYWVGGTTNWASVSWASGSGGVAAAADYPLAQDTATFDDASAAGITVTFATAMNVGSVSFAGRTTRAITLTLSASPNIYGSFTLSSQVTYTGTVALIFTGQGGTQTITLAGQTLTGSVTLNGTGTYRLGANFAIGSTLTTTLTSGTMDLQTFTWSSGLFSSTNTNVRSIAFGTGKMLLTGSGSTTIWSMSNGTNFSATGSKTVECNYSGATGYRLVQSGDNPAASVSEAAAPNIVVTGGGTDKFAFGSSAGLCRIGNLDMSGFAGTLGDSTNGNRNSPAVVYGNVTIGASCNMSGLTSTNGWFFAGTGTTQTLDFGGITLLNSVSLQASAGVTLARNLTVDATKATTLTVGALNLAGFTWATGTMGVTGSTARSIVFGGGKITVNGSGASAWVASGSNFTTSGSGTIEMASASAKTFAGGSVTYSCVLDQKGAGTLTISGSNTFANITNTVSATAATTITLTANTVQTLTVGCGLAGASGFVLTLNTSVGGTQAVVSYSGSTATMNYVSVKDIIARGGCRYYAFTGSTNNGNNAGLVFSRAAMRGMGGLMVAI